jgi:hypothetical protein
MNPDKIIVNEKVVLPEKKKKKQKNRKKVAKTMMEKPDKYKDPSQSQDPVKRISKNVLRQLSTQLSDSDKKFNSEVAKAILAIVYPEGSESVRFGSMFGSTKTAVAKPWSVFNSGWGAVSLTSTVQDSVVFAYPDPYCSLITVTTLTTSQTYTFSGTLPTPGTITGAGGTTYGVLPLNPSVMQGLPGYVHGRSWFPARLLRGPYQGYNFYYLQSGDSISITYNGGAQVFNVTLVKYWLGDVEESNSKTINGISTITMTMSSTGYYALKITSATTTNTLGGPEPFAISFTLSSTGPQANAYWSHQTMPFIDTNAASVDGIKVVGLSVLWTNTSPAMYKNGEIGMLQLPSTEQWPNYNNYGVLSDIQDAVTLPAANGGYIYRKMQQAKDLDFKIFEENYNPGTSYTDAYWPLERDADFLAVAAYVPVNTGQSAKIKVSYHVEYRTTDVWRDTEYPDISPAAVEQALLLISRCQQAFENPTHLSQLWDFFKDSIKGAYHLVKEAAPFMMTAAKIAAII